MDQKRIDRINELAHKSKAEGLTDAEKAEQTQLRNEYRQSVVGNLAAQLNNTYIMTPDGKKRKVGSKGGH
ncbi:MAG: DUF896 domain-containing protein [Ruminococcus sp.]|nr:DUF896 domain-containing protein [Ruminococcus sp.]